MKTISFPNPNFGEVRVKVDTKMIEVAIEGYGNEIGGEFPVAPIVVDLDSPVPQVVVWADYEEEEPTHNISLAKARIMETVKERFNRKMEDIELENMAADLESMLGWAG